MNILMKKFAIVTLSALLLGLYVAGAEETGGKTTGEPCDKECLWKHWERVVVDCQSQYSAEAAARGPEESWEEFERVWDCADGSIKRMEECANVAAVAYHMCISAYRSADASRRPRKTTIVVAFAWTTCTSASGSANAQARAIHPTMIAQRSAPSRLTSNAQKNANLRSTGVS
jgi:hypothetical protein